MNRRALLKGTAAGTAFMFSVRLGMHCAQAQTPAYAAEIVYEFTEFKEGTYKQLLDGGVGGVSPDGLIGGWDWSEGVLVPMTWDLSGVQTVLDTTGIPFARSWMIYAGSNDVVAGTLAATDAQDSPGIGVLWTNGIPRQLDAGDGSSFAVRSVNANGIVGGNVDSTPSRWIDGKLEQFAVPEGADGANVSYVAANGDGYGYAYTSSGDFHSLFHWNASGELAEIDLPTELAASGVVETVIPRVAGVFDNGDFVLSASWHDDSGYPDGAWLYQDGAPQRIASSSELGNAWINTALADGTMVGNINPGNGDGFSGPALWKDGVPYPLLELTTLPDGISYLGVRGMTEDGVIVATTVPSNSNPVPLYILALHPTA